MYLLKVCSILQFLIANKMHNRPRKKSDEQIDLQKEEVKRKKIAKYNELKTIVLEAVRTTHV